MDREVPEQLTINGLDDYLAALSRMVFQSGFSAAVVDAKWDGITAAFDGFVLDVVADYGPDEIDRLCADGTVIRNRRKVEAIVRNANRLQAIDEQQPFNEWLARFPDDEQREKAVAAEFAFLGPAGAHEFCWIVGASQPTRGCP